jgi:hypothetical protein
MLHADHLTVRGASGAEHRLRVSRWPAPLEDVPAVYVLLSRHGASEGTHTILHVAESERLETALAEHQEYPCMHTFVDAVGWLAVDSGEERASIAQDLVALQKPPCDGCWPPVQAGAEGEMPYPDRVVGGCVTERVTLDLRLEEAVRRKRIIRFVHDRRRVEAEPRDYGVREDGTLVLFAYETSYGAGGGGRKPWKTFPLDEIHGLVVTDRPWGGARPSVPSPVAVTFTSERSAGPEIDEEADPLRTADPLDLLRPLRRNVADLVRKLRHQLLELWGLEARAARLKYRLSNRGSPPELASVLAAVEVDRVRVAQEIRGLIPTVSALQKNGDNASEYVGPA